MACEKAGRKSVAEARQLTAVLAAVKWYLKTHYQRPTDPGMPAMFCDPERVGRFAVDEKALRRGDPASLFRTLIATTMFQRRQDQQIMRVLRHMPPRDALEVSDSEMLLALVDGAECDLVKSNATLLSGCDLAKDPTTRLGCCAARPGIACHLKRHTVALKRYGHFGKVPTSAALALREAGVTTLSGLRTQVLRRHSDPVERAAALEMALSRSWRISQKIACMFLATVATPDLSWPTAPWSRGVDWTRFVVIDSNVDRFLVSIGYRGRMTYDARRDFVLRISGEINLCSLDRRIKHAYNPRLVQQAMYAFMSASNRRALPEDCMHEPSACGRCPGALRERCPVRHQDRQSDGARSGRMRAG